MQALRCSHIFARGPLDSAQRRVMLVYAGTPLQQHFRACPTYLFARVKWTGPKIGFDLAVLSYENNIAYVNNCHRRNLRPA